ncbi:beta-glucosidase [Oceanobacillus limi]|uniref:Beta-glucosidase n=1 Tax=Oceanobacillus limi TaxID=930131 RepID=A0A1I0CXG3_9BACI|nr:GH1 family beta-glucosidase [Oceanobacillus limi]SET24456.1 beta-glucosidase [Oceanobacillus limi]
MAIIQLPKDLKFGVATAAYQIEGATNEDGRGQSIWDTFAKTPGKVVNGDNGDIACDSYHRYKEDVQLIKDLGCDMYRFSVSWPRILPNGTGDVNQAGLDYYHRLVDELIAQGIEPMCTLYHWDLPQALQDNGGWENRETIEAFVNYAEIMFKAFEGKINKWITINEPWCVSYLSNYLGVHAPGNQDLQAATTISHHLLVAHGKTVKRYRELGMEGEIGYAPNTTWKEPYSNQQQDIDACRREVGYLIDWFFDPVFLGSYPEHLVDWYKQKGVTLDIKAGDMELIQQKIDFVGINYYNGNVARYQSGSGLFDCEDIDMGYNRTDINWPIYPEGFYKVLTYIHDRYGDTPIYITENGACFNDDVQQGQVKDDGRIDYLKTHLASLQRSIDSGVPIKGYLCWSLLDNFEWAEGYTMRFGLVHMNYRTLERTKKDSYYWYQKVIDNGWYEL